MTAPLEFKFTCPLPNGLHARPASDLQAVASRFQATVTFHNDRNGQSANAKSILSLIGTAVRDKDPCRISVSGPDAQAALDALTHFLVHVFPHADAQAAPPLGTLRSTLPRSLTAAGLQHYYRGTPVSPGIARGRVFYLAPAATPQTPDGQVPVDPAAELQKAQRALAGLAAAMQSKLPASRPYEAAILRAHLSIVQDVSLADKIESLIAAGHCSAESAIRAAGEYFAATLQASTTSYLRERALDVRDVTTQLLNTLNPAGPAPALAPDSICVAEQLTPSQFLAMDPKRLKGLVLTRAGETSHTVILARALSIPALVNLAAPLQPGQEVILDANLGLLVTHLTPALERYYQFETQKLSRIRDRLRVRRHQPAATADGHRVELGVNITAPEEVAPAIAEGAEGVGLFRTEFIFLEPPSRPTPPSEEEQFRHYAEAARAAAGKPVIVRLLDAGGDKSVAYLNLPQEPNPFLGYRGARIYPAFLPLMKTQLRAILRASAVGDLRILLPMITTVEEARAGKDLLREAQMELAAAGTPVEKLPPLGVMIEVPAAAFLIPELAREIEFFSLGTNDLMQYFLAADRGNPLVAGLYAWTHPAFLRLLKKIADDARAHGRWLGLCGELGDQPAALPLLVALGLDEISMSAHHLPAAKARLARLRLADCQDLLARALQCSTRAAVESLLRQHAAGHFESADASPLVTEELLLQLAAATREEAIKEMADALAVAGRVESSYPLEAALWQAEDAASRSPAPGIAMLHCHAEALSADTLAVGRLPQPLPWNAAGPVNTLLLLVTRGTNDESRLTYLTEFARREREKLTSLTPPSALLPLMEHAFDAAPR